MTITQKVVTPVKTGVQGNCTCLNPLDSGFRRNDEMCVFRLFAGPSRMAHLLRCTWAFFDANGNVAGAEKTLVNAAG